MSALRRPARRVALGVSALIAVLLAAAAVFVVTNGLSGDRAGPAREGWAGFEAERGEMIRELAAPVLACVGRVDERARESAMFHGCGDWHNALAGHYALYTAYRRTGDVTYLRAAERQIHAGKVDAELRFLPQLVHPHNWRRHYGFPWLLAMLEQRDAALAMARQRGEAAGKAADLSPLAAEAVAWLRDWLAGLEPGRARGYALADQYVNLSWTVLNLIRWARHTNDEELLGLARTVVNEYLRVPALDRECPLRRDASADARQFIPPCLMRAAAVAELEGADAKAWIEERLPADFSVPPLTAPQTAEAAGLNFHRAATLGMLYRVTGRADLLDNYATLIRHHVAHPEQWRDDYRRHSQWVPQFGIHAIEQSYGWAG
ncbi:MAG TPA: DUF2891 family protein [Micromonosporaceae bacterium]|nr:DUF2891 family protein [Micromonosporaceae bacterium]